MTALWVAIGGAVGSVGRYLLVQLLPFRDFPYGILLVNIAGCFAIGLLRGLPAEKLMLSASARDAIIIGLLGGFTTFSAFAFDTMDMLLHGSRWLAIANIVSHILLCLGACVLGYLLARPV